MKREIPGVSLENKPTDDKPVVQSDNPNPYDNQELQKRYLTHDSVYLCLQKNLIKLVGLIKPQAILELGFGGSQTAVQVAEKNPNIAITVVNTYKPMTDMATKIAEEKGLTNITIRHEEKENLNNFIENELKNYDFIYLLYNFHHICDSSKRKKEKVDFLSSCCESMNLNSFLCIADDFLPENCHEDKLKTDNSLEVLYEQRARETESATFWNYLKGVNYEDIREAEEEATISKTREKQAYLKVKTQDGEYLIKKSWLVDKAKEEGFSVLINQDVNSVGDAILLFQKI
jgi:dsDNA-binding SOS-regulon protein